MSVWPLKLSLVPFAFLDCGDYMPDEHLDLPLYCENDCGAPVLNAFVPIADFRPIVS
jgi:hypothetical protein